MRLVKYRKSRIERTCDICGKPIHKGDLYRRERQPRRFGGEEWKICRGCDRKFRLSGRRTDSSAIKTIGRLKRRE